MKHYTTIEQSKKLVELGLNPNTADMQWFLEDDYGIVQIKEDLSDWGGDCAIPCWSLGALLEVMPVIDDHTYYLSGTLNKGAICEHPCTSVMFQEESPLEAVYNMICWLLERGYIKKGE